MRSDLTLEYYKKESLGESGGNVDADTIRDLLQDILHWMSSRLKPNDYSEPTDTLLHACEDACRDFPRELTEPESDGRKCPA
jgi:hypothetical protein